jgi:DNA mismatch endonuclease (patch repair protein)
MDVLTPDQRSYCMSQIRSRNTRPELMLRRALWKLGYRYRIGSKKLRGRPDIVFAQRRLAIFVDGCFWHRCPVHYREPVSNKAFWKTKISANVKRDRKVDAEIAGQCWVSLRFWQHQIQSELPAVIERISNHLRQPLEDKRIHR